VLDGARIFHVNVNCADLGRSRRFYVEGLGLTEGVRTAPAAAASGDAFGLERAWWDAWILVGSKGFEGGAVDLLEWREPGPAGHAPANVHTRGFQRLGIRVPDLDAAIAGVTAAGGEIWGEPHAHTAPDGREIPLVFVNDPDGVAIEVMAIGGPALSFVAVTVADLERSVAFYTSLGFEQRATFGSDNPDGANLRVDGRVAFEEAFLTAPGGGDITLILVAFAEPATVDAGERVANEIGIARLAMVVPDLDAAIASLPVATISPAVEMPMGEGLPDLKFVCFRGPDGELLELIEAPVA
jgi:catechol 2,3-dioxygenase-like lactoylglutathione lyase family enzyme